jgi:glycogen debranching enzyme
VNLTPIRRLSALAALAGLASAAPSGQAPQAPQTIPRFVREANPIAIVGPARPARYAEASGRRAAFLGREDGSFEAWVYPLKVLHDLNLSFGTAAYADPIPGASLASTVDIRPESMTVRYSHAAFTVDATWLVPLEEPGGIVLLDVHASEPLTVLVRFRPDLKPMWPAALGGQYSYWDDALKAYVVGEGSGKNAALIGSPFGLTPPEQPAHNLPDAPSQFAIRITPETAARGLVPIVITASVEKLDPAKKAYAKLLSSAEALYRESFGHYRRLRQEMTSVETPDARLDLAFEWAKVALDKGFVCNPHLGCGLIAGLGPSGTTERPGFGWFFGGDTFINAWAISAYGDLPTIRASLDFLRKRQRADGKMMHELSQGAGYIRWFEDYPYGYYHADTTPLYIISVRDYVRATGDAAFAKDYWPSMRRAWDYCASTDEDGDGLMDNTKAGLVIETGALRSRDVQTDVFLATVWTEAAAAMTDLARIAEPAFVPTAEAAAVKARAAINRRFLDDANRRINFAILKNGTGQAEQTDWPAFGIWRGVFDPGHAAVDGMLDELARAGLGTDWGARMLSNESTLYEPLSYNNGASWPFLSGWAALALYKGGRPDAAWQYVDALADLTFLEARGFIPELLSGDRLRSIDAAVPHQLFATTGFASALMRGLVGLEETDAGLRLSPQLPAGWPFLRVKRLSFRGARADVEIRRHDGGLSVRVDGDTQPLPLDIVLAFPPGSELAAAPRGAGWRALPARAGAAGPHARLTLRAGETPTSVTIPARPGVRLVPVHAPLALGDESQRLRVIDASVRDGVYVARLQGRTGRTYQARLDVPAGVVSIEGAAEVSREGTVRTLAIAVPPGPAAWGDVTLRVRLRSRQQPAGGGIKE